MAASSGTAIMSFGIASARRIPASKLPETISTIFPSTTISTVTSGNCAAIAGSTSCTSISAARRGELMRTVPATLPRKATTLLSASSNDTSAGLRRFKSLKPASVGEMLRVVRFNKRTPRRSSSPLIAWLNVDGAVSSSSAARRKLRCVATAINADRSLRVGRDIDGNFSLSRADCTV